MRQPGSCGGKNEGPRQVKHYYFEIPEKEAAAKRRLTFFQAAPGQKPEHVEGQKLRETPRIICWAAIYKDWPLF